jgi:dTDP-4-amino-4,6-dideoxygalactose transaminase
MLGIGAGDEVITTAHSWISTSETISQAGAKPVFVDVDEYFTIDVRQIERAITPHTRAIIPVHLFGQPADMDTIMDIAARHGLIVLEDCAQAHYATWKGRRVGTFGRVATFSFYPGKNLGAYGDAGAIITNDEELATRMRMFANHGALKKHNHLMEGINSRLDGIQAAILTAKLPHIHRWTRLRQEVAGWYDELLGDNASIATPKVRHGASHVFHLYVVKIQGRDETIKRLAASSVQTAVHYPVPLPLMPAYSHLNHSDTQFPVATANAGMILSLPIYPELSKSQAEFVVEKLLSAK